jgi:hypothetical protein
MAEQGASKPARRSSKLGKIISGLSPKGATKKTTSGDKTTSDDKANADATGYWLAKLEKEGNAPPTKLSLRDRLVEYYVVLGEHRHSAGTTLESINAHASKALKTYSAEFYGPLRTLTGGTLCIFPDLDIKYQTSCSTRDEISAYLIREAAKMKSAAQRGAGRGVAKRRTSGKGMNIFGSSPKGTSAKKHADSEAKSTMPLGGMIGNTMIGMPVVATALPADVVNIDATVPPDTLPGEQFDVKVGMEIEMYTQ